MDDFVCKILNDWGLSEWIETFREHGINKKNLYCLEDQDIEKLFSKVGPRADFRNKLKLLKIEQEQKNTTVKAEAEPSTSDGDTKKGKRKLDQGEFHKSEQTAKRFRRSMSASSSELMMLSDVKNVMRHVLAKLHNQETKLSAFLQNKIKDLETDRRELVGVFGKTGAGKTSLINAVIEEKKLLPSGDVDACTSVMIKVEANMCNTKYEAHIEFIPKEEWKDELWSMSQYLRNTLKKDDEDDDYQDIVEKLSALYGEEWNGKSSKHLMDPKYFKEIPQFLQSTIKKLSCETAKELSAKMIKYTRTESNHGGERGIKRWYWPLVKCVTVKVPRDDFPQHITLVDLPGNGDRNKSRDTMWKGIVGNCSTVWIVTEINRAASEKESWEILKSVSSLLGNGGECRDIHFICTKSDVIEDLTDHSSDLQGSILRRNNIAKEAVRRRFNRLKNFKKHFSDDSFKVYTVSSKEFLKTKVLSAENTEIPKLQDALQNLNDSHSETLNYVSGAHGILSLIHGASLEKQPGRNKELCEKLERDIVLHLDPVQRTIQKAYQVFETCLREGVEKSISSCEKKLHNFLFPRGNKGGYHGTLKSVFKNGGVSKTKKGKQINLNMKLSSFLTDSIDEEFRKTFPNEQKCGPFNGVIDKFSLDTESLMEKYKDVKLQLIFLQTEEERIKKKLNKRIRDQKKIMYNNLTETIEKSMQECYKTAAGYSGPGMLEKMRETVSRHVHRSKGTMFAKAKHAMLSHLLSLRVEILKTMKDTLNISIDLSLRTDSQAIPDVSAELAMVKKIYKNLKNSSN